MSCLSAAAKASLFSYRRFSRFSLEKKEDDIFNLSCSYCETFFLFHRVESKSDDEEEKKVISLLLSQKRVEVISSNKRKRGLQVRPLLTKGSLNRKKKVFVPTVAIVSNMADDDE